jgi:3-oxoacyl-[acyl-carrier protein] reductase
MAASRRVALVTGASRGIGAATARALGRDGYHVIINHRASPEAARAVAAGIEEAGGSAQVAQADICARDQVTRMVEGILAGHGRIDVLVCNANIQPPFAAVETMPWEDFIGKISDELAAAFHVTQCVLAAMRERRSGRIVYLSSIVADLARHGAVAHAAAKAALNAFSRHVAAEAGPHGIVVNAVAPGAVRTQAIDGVLPAGRRQFIAEHSVLGRMLEPDDIADLVAAIASPGYRGVTGELIRADAGLGILS